MVLIRIDPTKILVGGDKNKAETFIGQAKSQMELLKNQMSFQNLKQGVRRLWLNNDVFVECVKCFNYQECKIWARPFGGEEHPLKPVYFYVRIFCKDFYSVMEDGREEINPVGDRKMDRIIVWKCREEVKRDTPPHSYVDNGTYEDGTRWWVKKAGAVILDVDVENEIVYSGSGGVAVQSSLEEADQLAIAKKYIEKIDKGEYFIPKNHANDEYLQGTLFSPHALSAACNQGYHPLSQLGDPIYFDDYLLAAEVYGTPEEGCSKFYHMNQYAPSIMYWMTPEECPGCQNPENEYLKFNWPKLEINRDKYRPTQREIEQFYLNPIGGGIPCGTLVYDGGEYYENVYLASALKYLNYSPRLMCGNCGSSSMREEFENIKGFFFTTNNTYPCFFISEAGVARGKSETRFGYGDGNVYDDGTCTGESIYAGAKISVGENLIFHIQTPIELIDVSEFIKNSGGGNPCSETLAAYNYSHGGSLMLHDVGGLPVHEYWGSFPTGLFQETLIGETNFVSVSPEEIDDTFKVSLNIAKAPEKKGTVDKEDLYHVKKSEKKYVALSIYLEKNGAYKGLSGYVPGFEHDVFDGSSFVYCNGEQIESTLQHESLGRSYDYHIGMVFYLFQPSKDTWVNEITGEKEYWDIHSERESVEAEINHNRLLDLEDYVNQILKELKDLPENRVPETGEYKWLESQQGYRISSGFIYQMHKERL
jgi:hypothetical protein